MNTNRWIMTSLVVVAVLWILETIIHGFLLGGIYQQTAALWRPMAEMEKTIVLMWLGYFLFAPFFVYLYVQGMEPNKPVLGQGLRFGLIFGTGLSAMHNLGWYAVLPISGVLAFYWFLAGVAIYAAAGMATALIYQPVPARSASRRTPRARKRR